MPSSRIPGRVDDHRPAVQPEQLPVGGGVAASAVVLPDAARLHQLLARQRVQQAGLAHAGGAEKHDGFSRPQIAVQRGQPLPGFGADREHPDPGGQAFRPPARLGGIRVRSALLSTTRRQPLPTATPGSRTAPPPLVEIMIQGLEDKHGIEVGGHRLFTPPRRGSRREKKVLRGSVRRIRLSPWGLY